jgi:hypothetical protein
MHNILRFIHIPKTLLCCLSIVTLLKIIIPLLFKHYIKSG